MCNSYWKGNLVGANKSLRTLAAKLKIFFLLTIPTIIIIFLCFYNILSIFQGNLLFSPLQIIKYLQFNHHLP
jgi:hypothetical protein